MWRTTYRFKNPVIVFDISIHVPRVEDDVRKLDLLRGRGRFQSTSPVWRTTFFNPYTLTLIYDFNPRPPCGGRPLLCTVYSISKLISIHVPRVEDDQADADAQVMADISIHVPRVEDDQVQHLQRLQMLISIHVPRVEDDVVHFFGAFLYKNFNPRPPCGGRLHAGYSVCPGSVFQSTSPVWRTTSRITGRGAADTFQSTSPVWRTTFAK